MVIQRQRGDMAILREMGHLAILIERGTVLFCGKGKICILR